MKLRWTIPALRDLEAIGDFIVRENSHEQSTRIITTILDRVGTLTEFPHSGRPGRLVETRELVIIGTPFIVPYRVRDEAVDILAVFHGARRWPEAFD